MLRDVCSHLLAASPLANWPVTVKHGLAKGARWTAFPFSANWRFGASEPDVEVAISYLRNLKGKIFWDFGAHFGLHTVGMAMQVGRDGEVAAFEPDPIAFKKLDLHIRMNGLTNVKLFNAAVSSRCGTGSLYIPGVAGSAVSHFKYDDDEDVRNYTKLDVKTVSPDALVSSGAIRLPSLIKVDIQGHGAEALEGSIASIRAAMPVIAFSGHSSHELEGARGLLEPLGYVPLGLDRTPITWSRVAIILPPGLVSATRSQL